ncbi:MAG TPA: hypothetical protein VGQ76_14555 [Thermoanaerobaculia bacterium]|jgi:hypothetical protein|nr:hypothetical protein [Thermoanaerobaculia bacterium]
MTATVNYCLGLIVTSKNPAAGRRSLAPRAEMVSILELQLTEYQALRAANDELTRHRDRLRFLDLIHWNLEEYLILQERLLIDGFERTGNPLRSAGLDLNRRVMNLLSAIRSYLDHTETDLKRRFGDTSDRVNRFKALTNKLYDNQFSYRFIYRFRNFVQHCGLPLDTFSHEASPTSRMLQAAVSRSRLLDGFDWGSLRHEIERLPEKVDLTELLVAHVTHLSELHQRLCAEELPAVKHAAARILSAASHTEGLSGIPAVMAFERDPEQGRTIAGGRNVQIDCLPLHVDLAKVFDTQLRRQRPNDS